MHRISLFRFKFRFSVVSGDLSEALCALCCLAQWGSSYIEASPLPTR